MKTKMKSSIPDILVVLGYDGIYSDYKSVNAHDLLKNIPTLSVLHYITQKTNQITYSFGNQSLQREMVHEMNKYLPKTVRKKVQEFIWKHKSISYIDFYGSMLLMGLALQNFTPHEEDDKELSLCQDEYEAVFKAVIYCNQRWTDEQSQGVDNRISKDIVSMSLLIDLPIVEFKLHKDFKAQLYKAFCFFDFCEGDKEYVEYLKSFCNNKNVENWQEYISRLFGFFEASLRSQYIKVDTKIENDVRFFNQYMVSLQDCKDLWSEHNASKYFRDHFLLKITDDTYLLLNANLLIDKFYQGLKFDFFQSLNGKYKTYPDFNSDLATRFSERHLLYRLMQKIYPDNGKTKMFTGEGLKQKGVTGEPDLYLRIGTTLFLFEYKDITLGDNIKYSQDIQAIKRGINDRLCKYGKKKKGAGQLFYNIRRILLENLMEEFDSSINNISEIYPIIVTTDRSFSAIGVNAFVTQEFSDIISNNPINKKVFISVPVIMGLDTLISCAKELSDGTISLKDILDKYLQEANLLNSFDIYMYDNYFKNKRLQASETEFLFGEHLSNMITSYST